eukprot:1150744-Pelagomonas_calceolata.AAC.1
MAPYLRTTHYAQSDDMYSSMDQNNISFILSYIFFFMNRLAVSRFDWRPSFSFSSIELALVGRYSYVGRSKRKKKVGSENIPYID